MSQTKTIAIVGGGAAGVSVFAQFVEYLANKRLKDVSLVLIEKGQRVGPGMPYETLYDESILNMRYQKMNIFPDKPNHVAEWLSQNKLKWASKYPSFEPEADPYPPRSLYGLYLEDVFTQALSKAKASGIDVRLVRATVTDVQEGPEEVTISCDDGESILSSKVILALGNFEPTTYKELMGKPGYFPSFWPDVKTLASIPKDASIGILGTRLTAVDASLTLLSNGYTNTVSLVSRSGLLPKVQATELEPIYREAILKKAQAACVNGVISLNDLIHILKEQIEESCGGSIDWEAVLKPTGSVIEILEKDIESAKNGIASRWQSVLASTSDIIEVLWNMLTDADKSFFLEKYGSIWYVYRHAMPLKNAQKVLGHLKSGQLKVFSGIKSVSYDEAAKSFKISLESENLNFDKIINTTDAGLDITQIEAPLIQSLLKSGIFRPNMHGGIDVDLKNCRAINKEGKASDKVYTLGYLTRGVHFYTNDVGRLVAYAKRIVDDIVTSF